MKNSILLTVAAYLILSALVGVSDPVLAEEQGPTELDELSLYFKTDQLVEVATRSPKPLIQVAENITIVTADEIEAMNAHTLAEVLNRVAGIIIDGNYSDFGSPSGIFIQGSDYEHVLVLLDGIRWGYVGFDFPETNTIPVQIIKRIEIIRGAASSTWGSSLGGVVNIITKDTGSAPRPKGTLTATYGKNDSTDLRGDAAGRIGRFGYYFYGGYQDSDGIRFNRFFNNKSLYAKLSLELPHGMDAGVSLGYSRPKYKYYYLRNSIYDDMLDAWFDYEGIAKDHVSFATGFFSTPLTESFTLNLSVYRFADTYTDEGLAVPTGVTTDYDYVNEFEGKATGISGRLTWEGKSQTVVLGTEFEHREDTDKDIIYSYQAPTTSEEIWAFYANDTIRINKLTIIPGLRYDRLSIADNRLSPSFGLTYQLTNKTLLRSSISRGFRKPYAPLKEGDVYFFGVVSPNLESEEINSFQVGLETTGIPFFKLKTTVFLHQAEDVWVTDPDTWMKVNDGGFDRRGVELELLSVPFHDFSVGINAMFLRMQPDKAPDGTDYVANILLQYDDGRWRGQVFGHNVWLGNVSPPTTYEDKSGSFLWDLVVGRRIAVKGETTAELFLEVHNIFNDDLYFQSIFPNAGRWAECGIRVKY